MGNSYAVDPNVDVGMSNISLWNNTKNAFSGNSSLTRDLALAKVKRNSSFSINSAGHVVFKNLTPAQIELLEDAGAQPYKNSTVRLIAPVGQGKISGLEPKVRISATDLGPMNAGSIKGVGADVLHKAGIKGQGVHVFIADTGLAKHPDIEDANVMDYNDHTTPGEETKDDRTDAQGHGTHVAGTAVGKYGLAPKALIHSEQVLGANGSGSVSTILAGMDSAIQFKKKNPDTPVILTMSLGGTAQSEDPNDDPMVKKVQEAKALGIVVTLALGNSGKDGTCTIGSPAVAASEAAGHAAFGVAAVDFKDDPAAYGTHEIASFSSTASPNPDAGKGQGSVGIFSAKGVNVESADAKTGGRIKYSGTSMATPAMAGVNALLMGYANSRGYYKDQLVKDSAFQRVLAWSAMGIDNPKNLENWADKLGTGLAVKTSMNELLGPVVMRELRRVAELGAGDATGYREGAGTVRVDLAKILLDRWYGANKQVDPPEDIFPPWVKEGEDTSAECKDGGGGGSPIPGLPVDWQKLIGQYTPEFIREAAKLDF